jgi:predicted phosphodiesterase
MKIAWASDLHLEFGERDFDLPDADVLILAGDICLIRDLTDPFTGNLKSSWTRQFFKDVSKKYEHVIWLFGNHEFYDSNMADVDKIVSDFITEEKLFNIAYGQQGWLVVDDVKFVFATMWTDINRGNPLNMGDAARSINDYLAIMVPAETGIYPNRNLTPKDTTIQHDFQRWYVREQIEYREAVYGHEQHEKVVVVTHHAPNLLSASAERPSSMDFFYCSTDLDNLILDNPQIKKWIHGHTHSNSDYMIGDTNVLSNCRGYKNYERSAETFKVQVFEL